MSHTRFALYGALAAQVGAVNTAAGPATIAPAANIPAIPAIVATYAPSMDTTLVTVCVSSRDISLLFISRF